MSVLHARSGVVLTLIYRKKQNLAYLTFVKEKNWLMLNLVKLEKKQWEGGTRQKAT